MGARRSLLWGAVGLGLLVLAGLGAWALQPGGSDTWPTRPVTLIVPSGAGGGTDRTGRLLAERLGARFGQPFTIVNQGQGGGVVGIGTLKGAAPDGYTLGILYNYAHYAPMGQADVQAGDFTPIAQYNADPAGFHVHADSPWPDLPAALDALKAEPDRYTIACAGGCGGSWPVAVATLLDTWGVDLARVRMIPSQGAAASLQDLAAGGVDVVPCSLPEAGPLLQAGVVRSLAVFGAARLEAFPDVPTLEEETGLTLTLGAWRGLVGPAGLPDPVAQALEAALRDIVHDPAFRAEMTGHGFGVQWRDSETFAAFLRDEETSVRAVVARLGL